MSERRYDSSPLFYRKEARRLSRECIGGLRPLSVAIVSTFRAESLADYLIVEGANRGFKISTYFSPYAQFEIDCNDEESHFFASRPDVVVVASRIEDLASHARSEADLQAATERLMECINTMIQNVRRRTSASVVVFNYAQPLYRTASTSSWDKANGALEALCQHVPGVFMLDLARLALEMGARQMYDLRLEYLARIPFSVSAQIEIARSLARLLRTLYVAPAKCLVLDLDNTLWGGEIGELGIEGIDLGDDYPGNAYRDFQHALLGLRRQGLLLAVASKNDEAAVRPAFERHRDMILKWSDFSATEIHWGDKTSSICRIADSLGIRLDSIAFYDDDAVEREAIRTRLPEVKVIEVPSEPLLRVESLLGCEVFDRLPVTEEDRRRADFYKADAARQFALDRSGALEEFLSHLQLRCVIGSTTEATLRRVAQLINKTNQFNLTSRRYTEAELDEQLRSGAVGLWIRASDRFGDYGLVGAVFAVHHGDNDWRIDNFVLSCRVIGRRIETALLSALAQRVQVLGGKRLLGEYVPTARNSVASDFYGRHGFEKDCDGSWICGQSAIGPPSVMQVEILPPEENAIE